MAKYYLRSVKFCQKTTAYFSKWHHRTSLIFITRLNFLITLDLRNDTCGEWDENGKYEM